MSTNKSLLAAAIAVFACGAANADMVAYNGTVAYPGATSSPANTDFTYSITLPDFNPTLGTLTGVTIIFYAQENVSSVTMSNGGTNTSTNFTFSENSNVTSGFSNSAVATDVFSGGRTLTPYSLGPITLGGTSAPTTNCPDSTPSASCNTVTYSGLNVEDDVVDSQTNGGFATFTGTNGLTGLRIVDNNHNASYTGAASTFTLGGSTFGTITVGGAATGGGAAVATGLVNAEVDYTFTDPPSGTPEPTTMVLFGSALVGLGVIRKRVRS